MKEDILINLKGFFNLKGTKFERNKTSILNYNKKKFNRIINIKATWYIKDDTEYNKYLIKKYNATEVKENLFSFNELLDLLNVSKIFDKRKKTRLLIIKYFNLNSININGSYFFTPDNEKILKFINQINNKNIFSLFTSRDDDFYDDELFDVVYNLTSQTKIKGYK